MKLVRVSAATLIILLALLFLAATISARPGNPGIYPPKEGEPGVAVYVVRNWLHANLTVPRQQLRDASSGPAAAALDRLPPGEWVTIGWGDAKHYRERGDSPARRRSLLRSLFVPDNPAVILLDVDSAAPTPQDTGRRIVRLDLSAEGFERLAQRLDSSFELTPDRNVPAVAGRGRAPESLFFYSSETTDLFFACNHWIADLLDAAGVPTTPFLDTLTVGLAWDLKLRAGAEDVGGPVGEGTAPGHETPPVHSGRFEPLSDPGDGLEAIEFEGYSITIGDADMQTRSVGLVQAGSAAAPGGRLWSEVLDVPRTSLVERRVVVSTDPALCDGAPLTELALGFRVSTQERYDVVLAAVSAEEVCVVHWFRQP